MTSDADRASESTAPQPAGRKISPAEIGWFVVIAATIVVQLLHPFGATSLDFFAHCAVGRWIWTNHAIPRETLFLWSAHQPWIDHSWLSQALFYSFMRGGDAQGEALALGWTALMAVLVYGVLFFGIKPREPRPILFVATFAAGLYLSQLRFVPRPERWSDLGTVLLLAWLVAWPTQSERPLGALVRRGAPIVVLFALWANLHGGLFYGLALIGLTLFADAVQDRNSVRTRALAVVLALCALAVALNPYGFHYYALLGQIHSATFALIDEWRPPFAAPRIDNLDCVFIAIVFAVALYVWARSPERRWAHLLWIGFAAAAFLTARRNVITADWICLAIVAHYRARLEWEKVATTDTETTRGTVRPLRIVAGLLTLGGFGYWIDTSPLVHNGWPTNMEKSDELPVNAARFLVDSHASGAVLNTYATSAYYEWKLYGRNTFLIDPINAYPDSLMDRFVHIVQGADPTARTYLAANDVNIVQADGPGIPEGLPTNLALYQAMARNPRWVLVYASDDGYVWVRKVPETEYLWSHPVQP